MVEVRYFRPHDWADWQDCRYKNAKFIKTYPDALDNLKFQKLTALQRGVLISLWMAWGRVGRPLPWDCPHLARLLVIDCNALGKALPALERNNFIELCARTSPLFDSHRTATKPPESKRVESKSIDTLPNGNGAEAPPSTDLKSQIFGPCLGWLADKTGKQPKTLRPMIGRWCSRFGDGPALEAIMMAQRNDPVESVAYIERILKHGGVRDGPRSEEARQEAEGQMDDLINKAIREADERDDEHKDSGEINRLGQA